MSPAGECDCWRWFVTCRETERSPAAWWPCPLTPPCRRLGVPLSGFCFRKQCRTAWGTTGPRRGTRVPMAPVSCPGEGSSWRLEGARPAAGAGLASESCGVGSPFLWAPPSQEGAPRLGVPGLLWGTAPLSVLGSRLTPRGGVESLGCRSPGSGLGVGCFLLGCPGRTSKSTLRAQKRLLLTLQQLPPFACFQFLLGDKKAL